MLMPSSCMPMCGSEGLRGTFTLPDGYVIDSWIPDANKENDYLINRDIQKHGNFTGIWGLNDRTAASKRRWGRSRQEQGTSRDKLGTGMGRLAWFLCGCYGRLGHCSGAHIPVLEIINFIGFVGYLVWLLVIAFLLWRRSNPSRGATASGRI